MMEFLAGLRRQPDVPPSMLTVEHHLKTINNELGDIQALAIKARDIARDLGDEGLAEKIDEIRLGMAEWRLAIMLIVGLSKLR